MDLDRAVNVDDLRKLAKKRMPKIAFDFIEGGCDDEDGLTRNERAFRDKAIVPRYMVDVSKRDQTATLFGRTYASPFGISPTGLAALFRPGADMMLAEAARDANLPFVMSGTGTGLIEDLGRVAPDHGWYQLYPARDRKISEDIIRRAHDAGLSTLVVTVDVPAGSKRERNMRNGFTRPLRLSLLTKLDALRYPGWLSDYLKHGMPMFQNWQRYAGPNADADAVATFVSSQTRASVTWKDIEDFRRLWPGNFVIKGIMHPDDALRAAELGVDGLVVSNHGGRQLDRAPAALDVLPAINAAVGDRMTLMLDSGIRRGSDVVIALCMGAKFVFLGRPTLYGAAAGGVPGVARALTIVREELDMTMAQMGAPTLADLGPHFMMWDRPEDLRRNSPGLVSAAE
ncbi:(S)-mandelate dehydrogenase [Constrictibacter sp. MBR-5]|jgi:L-lactate dehydrogenase (cytochrome)/(S)-mandelate dehydrogenase|uniref:alpha-hydroxy acid oxidase n=1 Tax=Constrictibacter sp. MBR-5 TaxID=3156467 RepID=UPI00339089E1